MIAEATVPTHDGKTERALLGACLLDANQLDEVAPILGPHDFHDHRHATIFSTMLEIQRAGKRIDDRLLVDRLEKANQLESIGGLATIAEMAQEVPVPSNAPYYAEIIRDHSIRRAIAYASGEAMSSARDLTTSTTDLLAATEQAFFAIRDRGASNDLVGFRDVLHEALAGMDRRADGATRDGTCTGYDDLDSIIGGMRPGEVSVLAGRPAMGKTSLALNIAERVAIDGGEPVLVVSLEMTRLELADRILCGRAGVAIHRARNGLLSRDDRQRIVRTAGEINRAPLTFFDPTSARVGDIASAARRTKRLSKGLGLIVIDYVGLVAPDDPRSPRQEQVSRVSRLVKELARQIRVPIVLLAQLNRQLESTADKEPQLWHLRESGSLEQDADNVWMIHRPGAYRADVDPSVAQLFVRKNRNGPCGKIDLCWAPALTRYEPVRTDGPRQTTFADEF